MPPGDGQVPPHPQPRIPGAGTSRLPQAARQEYDAYMINKIRQQQQQQQQQGPRPPIQIVGVCYYYTVYTGACLFCFGGEVSVFKVCQSYEFNASGFLTICL